MGSVNSAISQNTSNIINDLSNKMTSNMTKTCENNVKNIQDVQIVLKNIDGCSVNYQGTEQKINTKIDASCIQMSITKTELQTELNNALDQFTKSTSGIGLLSASSTISNNISEVRNAINNEKVLNDIMSALNKTVNKQGNVISIDGYKCRSTITRDIFGNETIHGNTIDLGNTNQILISDTVFKGLQSSDELNKSVSALDNSVKQKADSTTLGVFDGIAQIGGPLTAIIAIISVAMVLLALVKAGIFGGKTDVLQSETYPSSYQRGTSTTSTPNNNSGGMFVSGNHHIISISGMIMIGSIVGVSTAIGLIASVPNQNGQTGEQTTIIALFGTSLLTYCICLVLFTIFSLFVRNDVKPGVLLKFRTSCSSHSKLIFYLLMLFLAVSFFLAMGSLIVKLSEVNNQKQLLEEMKTPAP